MENRVFYSEPIKLPRVLIYIIPFIITVSLITSLPFFFDKSYYEQKIEIVDKSLSQQEKKSYIAIQTQKLQEESLKNYFFLSLIAGAIVVALFEVFFRRYYLIKIEFFQNYFTFKGKNFQYIDFNGFDFVDRKIVLYMKHYKDPITIYFLDEDDANDFAFEIKQRVYMEKEE